MLRFLGVIGRPSQKKNKCQAQAMYFTAGCNKLAKDTAQTGKKRKLRKNPGWALKSPMGDLHMRRFIVAVDGVVNSIGRAPGTVSEYVVKVQRQLQ